MIIVDSNIDFAQGLKQHMGVAEAVIISSKFPLEELAIEITRKIGYLEQIIYINVEGTFASPNVLDQQGVTLLIWLRCKHKLRNPVVLYGFQSVETMLRQKPHNLILLSEGTYYVRLPSDFSLVKDKQLASLSDLSNIRPFLRSALNMEQLRHSFANRRGIIRLSLAWDEIQSTNLRNKKHPISQTLEEVIAEFIYLNINEKPYNARDSHIFKSQIKYYQSQLTNKKIIYIDDQASEGWTKILLKVLGMKSNQIFVLSKINENSLFADCQELIDKIKPDCILLDLRLIPRIDDKASNETQYTGAKLAKKIKNSYSSIPIIMFSASNKSENLRLALQNGCESLWTKEGIDDYKGMKYSITNLFRLVKMVAEASNKFSNENFKVNFEADTLISKIERRAHAINIDRLKPKVPKLAILDGLNKTVVDTSFLLETDLKNTPNHSANLFLFFYMCKHIYKRPVLILDDVLLEIIRFSKMVDYDTKKDLIERSRYLLAKLYAWSEIGLVHFGWADTENFAAKLRESDTETDILFDEESSEQETDNFINMWINKLLKSIKKKFDPQTLDPSASKMENEMQLHADDTLVNIAPKLIAKGHTVLFLSEDFDCSLRVGESVLESCKVLGVETSVRFDSKQNSDAQCSSQITGTLNKNILYKRMRSKEFNLIFNQVRNEVMKLPLIE